MKTVADYTKDELIKIGQRRLLQGRVKAEAVKRLIAEHREEYKGLSQHLRDELMSRPAPAAALHIGERTVSMRQLYAAKAKVKAGKMTEHELVELRARLW